MTDIQNAKPICKVNVTLSEMKRPEEHELIMLAKDDTEIQDKIERWKKHTHRGTHILSWHRKETKTYGKHKDS